MALQVNGTEVSSVTLNGNVLDKVTVNGNTVWENWKHSTTVISKSISSSSGGWGEWYGFDSGWITLDKPIKNPKGSLYWHTKDTQASNYRGYVRYEDNTEAQIVSASGGYHGGGETASGTVNFSLTNDKVIIAYKVYAEHQKFSGSSGATFKFTDYYQKG